MPDALLALLATAAIANRASNAARSNPVWLWAVAVAAILVHARGAPLLLLPVLALASNPATAKRRMQALQRPALWIAVVASALLVIPWLIFEHQTGRITPLGVVKAATAFPLHALHALGVVPFAMTVGGAFAVPYRREKRWCAVTALVLANWLLFSLAIVPWEDRYLMEALPACALLMTGAWRWLAERAQPLTGLPGGAILAAVASGTALACLGHPPVWPKPNANSEAVVRQVMAGPDAESTVYLIAGTAGPEGAFIAAVDLADRRGRHIVLRSSKVLMISDWSGFYYSPLFHGRQETAAYLAASPISVVVIETSPQRPDLQMLRDAVRETPSWTELAGAPGYRIYRRTFPLPPAPLTVRLDMRYTLGKYLEWTQ